MSSRGRQLLLVYLAEYRNDLADDVAFQAPLDLPAGLALATQQVASEIARTYPSGIPQVGQRLVDDPAGTLDELVEQMRTLAGRGLLLVPAVFTWPNVWPRTDPPWDPALVYPPPGIADLWTPDGHRHDALASLLGRRRAQVLVELDRPASTLELVRRMEVSPGSVSDHLTTLRRAGLVTGGARADGSSTPAPLPATTSARRGSDGRAVLQPAAPTPHPPNPSIPACSLHFGHTGDRRGSRIRGKAEAGRVIAQWQALGHRPSGANRALGYDGSEGTRPHLAQAASVWNSHWPSSVQRLLFELCRRGT